MRRQIASLAILFAAFAGSARAETVATMPLPDLVPARIELRETDAGTVLRVDGVITHDIADRFAAAVTALPQGRPLLLELNSPGGFTKAGYAVIDRILAERDSGRPVATLVKSGESCESMCFGLYMAGYPRYAEKGAEFMVHAPRQLDTGVVTIKSTGRMIDRFVRLGASPEWIERVKAEGGFSGQRDYRERAEALVETGANVVTQLVEAR
ncbi:MAG TPA: ATP-dependent Clp protease proteolytic subunit [Azospirillaceae bacterium]|nr:ATP-dependent Clp protease proteolytic subunit [Azospirillaceae bacterium]